MLTVLIMIHMFLSMMIGLDVATGNYTRMAIELVGQAIIWVVMEALDHD